MTQTPRFKIGTTFTPQGRKGAGVHTVTDVLTTRNSKGEVVKIRYEATHEFCGQTLTDTDVLETTIARGLISQPSPTPLEDFQTKLNTFDAKPSVSSRAAAIDAWESLGMDADDLAEEDRRTLSTAYNWLVDQQEA